MSRSSKQKFALSYQWQISHLCQKIKLVWMLKAISCLNKTKNAKKLDTIKRTNLIWVPGQSRAHSNKKKLAGQRAKTAVWPVPFLVITRKQTTSVLNVKVYETLKGKWLSSSGCC